jgi:hypothetical protein
LGALKKLAAEERSPAYAVVVLVDAGWRGAFLQPDEE